MRRPRINDCPVGCGKNIWPSDTIRLVDQQGRGVMLFTTEHLLAYCIKSNPSIKFLWREEVEQTSAR